MLLLLLLLFFLWISTAIISFTEGKGKQTTQTEKKNIFKSFLS